MEYKQIVDNSSSVIFAYLALRCSNVLFNHLHECLTMESLSWADFLQLAPETRIRRFPFLSGETHLRLTQLLKQPEPVYQILQRMQEGAISVILKDDRRYPWRLREELKANAPPILFYKGNPDCLRRKQLAIVGTRRASPAG
ncbi:MAG: DNA-processing protein DprA, partial [Candidatus Sumerlaeia bacterium]|nr:DNA-processing protein DprA [Candidatus Sumerlaeia bacterium]